MGEPPDFWGKPGFFLRVVLAIVLTLPLVGCGGGAVMAPTPTPSPTPHIVHLPSVGNAGSSPLPTPSPTAAPKPTPSGPTPLPPPVPKPGYGVQVHLLAGDVNQTLEWTRGLGVGWVKQQVEWHTIEHGPDNFDWATLDRAVDAADGFDFKILLSVSHAPDWIRPTTEESGPPADYAEFGRFMGQLAARYEGRRGVSRHGLARRGAR